MPHSLALRWNVLRDFLYDARRYLRHSGVPDADGERSLETVVVIDTHRIEKGLASARPRPWFGEAVLPRLVAGAAALAEANPESEAARSARDALRAYFNWHEMHAGDAPEWVDGARRSCAELESRLVDDPAEDATVTYTRDELIKAAPADPLAFFATRRSIRWFDERMVEPELIARAVEMAQRSPSGWNRQSWQVHVYPRGQAAERVLACQGGNRGFGHTASHVLVLSADLRAFVFADERNQCWVDGGLFAMSLVYAFHALGLGSCCLNWSVGRESDRRLRRAASLPEHENVIMMLAIGHLPETVTTTASRRDSRPPIVDHSDDSGPLSAAS